VIRKLLEDEFPCKVSILRDSIHCGVLEDEKFDSKRIVAFRGVQSIHGSDAIRSNLSLTLLAGHRETISALVTGTQQTKDFYNLVSHGTSWNIFDDADFYLTAFSKEQQSKYLSLVNRAFFNTQPDSRLCLPYTYNLLSTVEYLSKIGLLELICILSPIINIQGEKQIQKQRHSKNERQKRSL
jgi:hypothetical protein